MSPARAASAAARWGRVAPLIAAALLAATLAAVSSQLAARRPDDHRGRGSLIVNSQAPQESLRVTILIWPTSVSPQRHAERLQAISETWASSATTACGGELRFRFARGGDAEGLSVAAAGFGSVEELVGARAGSPRTVIEQADRKPGAELAQAMRDALAEDRPDWLVSADSISFLVPGNLLRLLRRAGAAAVAGGTPPPIEVLGNELCAGESRCGERFVSGGAGYAMHASTVRALLAADRASDPNCLSSAKGAVDIRLARCLATHLNGTVGGKRSRAAHDGCDLFHAYGVVKTARGSGVDDWYLQYKRLAGLGGAVDTCSLSPESVSLHYVEAAEARALWHDLETANAGDAERASLQELAARRGRWPSTHNAAGGYSALLPDAGTDNNKEVEEELRGLLAQVDALASASRSCTA